MEAAYIKYLLEIREPSMTLTAIARQTGYSRPLVSLVIRRLRRNPIIEKAIARAIRKPVAEVFPDNIPLKTAA